MGRPITPTDFILAWAIATVVAVAVFLHANRHGSKHATAWGVGVFLFMIVVLPAYLVHTWGRRGARRY
ncbi:MAG TPA: hypothetical protein VIU86_08075 [Gaiellaceae bacterium]